MHNDMQTGLLCARKRHFFPIVHSSRTILAFLLSIQKPFLVEIDLGVVDQEKETKKNGDYLDLGMFRLVWNTFFLVSFAF